MSSAHRIAEAHFTFTPRSRRRFITFAAPRPAGPYTAVSSCRRVSARRRRRATLDARDVKRWRTARSNVMNGAGWLFLKFRPKTPTRRWPILRRRRWRRLRRRGDRHCHQRGAAADASSRAARRSASTFVRDHRRAGAASRSTFASRRVAPRRHPSARRGQVPRCTPASTRWAAREVAAPCTSGSRRARTRAASARRRSSPHALEIAVESRPMSSTARRRHLRVVSNLIVWPLAWLVRSLPGFRDVRDPRAASRSLQSVRASENVYIVRRCGAENGARRGPTRRRCRPRRACCRSRPSRRRRPAASPRAAARLSRCPRGRSA